MGGNVELSREEGVDANISDTESVTEKTVIENINFAGDETLLVNTEIDKTEDSTFIKEEGKKLASLEPHSEEENQVTNISETQAVEKETESVKENTKSENVTEDEPSTEIEQRENNTSIIDGEDKIKNDETHTDGKNAGIEISETQNVEKE